MLSCTSVQDEISNNFQYLLIFLPMFNFLQIHFRLTVFPEPLGPVRSTMFPSHDFRAASKSSTFLWWITRSVTLFGSYVSLQETWDSFLAVRGALNVKLGSRHMESTLVTSSLGFLALLGSLCFLGCRSSSSSKPKFVVQFMMLKSCKKQQSE